MKKKIMVIALLLVALCGQFAGRAFYQSLKTATKYQEAEELLLQGKYEEAKRLYDELNYRSSKEKSRECSFYIAESLFLEGDYTAAKEIYISLDEYKSAAVKILACEYLNQKDVEASPNYGTARSLIDGLGEEISAGERERVSCYLHASIALSQGDFETAQLRFKALKDFADSREQTEYCQQHFFDLAVESMYKREFEAALESFSLADMPAQSGTYELYCRDRLEGGDIEYPEGILSQNSVDSFQNGELYFYSRSYIYVPHEIDETTRFSVYFAGGGGEKLLFMEGVYEYLGKYSPNAVMVFYDNSGLPNMEFSCDRMIAISNQIAAECGIAIHDLAISGSSSGCYTALHAAAAFYTKNHVTARAVFTLDTGFDWESNLNLSAEERAATAEAGVKYYLFEQAGTGTKIAAIHDLVESGNDVTAVYCVHDDHDKMSRLAYTNGLFSWAMGEFDELDEREYTFCPLSLTDPETEEREDMEAN